MDSLLLKFSNILARQAMLGKGDHVLVAVSGGADSVALLKLLALTMQELRLRLTVGHLNHGIRGEEADCDEDFVRQLSEGMGIPFITRKVDADVYQRGSHRSLEEVAREERYRFLEETAIGCGADKIATAHHQGDQAETLLLHMIRGCGLEGLQGIHPIRHGRIIRPLLWITRQEIEAFLRRQGLGYRCDSSNANTRFLRNRIRLELLPKLVRQYNPRFTEGICQMAEILRRDDDYLQSKTKEVLKAWGVQGGERGGIDLPLMPFLELHEALQARLIKRALEISTVKARAIGCRHVEAVLRLCQSSTVRRVRLDLPGRVTAIREGDTLRLRQEPGRPARKTQGEFPDARDYLYPVAIPGTVQVSPSGRAIRFSWSTPPPLKQVKSSPSEVYFDFHQVVPPLVLRNARPGDRIAPLGMKGTKKVHDVLIDRKIPRAERQQIPLLVDAHSVIWIAGQMISERVKVTGRSALVLKAEMV